MLSASSLTPPHPPPDRADSPVDESDKQWKADLRKRYSIELDLRYMEAQNQTVRDATLNSRPSQFATQLSLEIPKRKEAEAKRREEEMLLWEREEQQKEGEREAQYYPRSLEQELQNSVNASFNSWSPNRPSPTTGSTGDRSQGHSPLSPYAASLSSSRPGPTSNSHTINTSFSSSPRPFSPTLRLSPTRARTGSSRDVSLCDQVRRARVGPAHGRA